MSVNQMRKVKVWDVPTRLFHWSLVVGILVSYLTFEFDYMDIHVISGACVLALVIFRLVWGVIGSSTAQFHRFVSSPKAVLNYIRQPEDFKQKPGHSPLAALSVLALLLSLSVQAITGLFVDDEIYITGPLVKFASTETVEWAAFIHAYNSDVLLALIVVHLVAVFFYLLVKKDNLIGPMVTGWKKISVHIDMDAVVFKSSILFVIVALCAAFISYAIFNLI